MTVNIAYNIGKVIY